MLLSRAVIIVLAFGLASCSKPSEDPASDDGWPKHGLTEEQANEVLVKVGDRTITVGDFADRLAMQSPYLQARFESPERRREFLDNLVRYELLVYEAKRRGYANDPEVVRARRDVMIQELVKREVDAPLAENEISDEEVQAAYEADPTAFDRPAQVRASHIFVRTRGRASLVLAKAQAADRATFAELARDESEDENTAANGGDLDFFTADADEPIRELRDAAFAMNRVGDIHPELIEAGGGYHILMLTGKRAALTRTYEQAKRAIRHKLVRERKDAAIEALTERLEKEIDVEVDYEALEQVRVEVEEKPARP